MSIFSSVTATLFKRKSEQLLAQYDTKLHKLADQEYADQLLADLYELAVSSINDGNEQVFYKTVELLQLAFGKGIFREDEPGNIKSLFILTMSLQQYHAGEHVLSLYRPLARWGLPILQELPEQFTLMSSLAYKTGQHFLISRIIEIVFLVMSKQETQETLCQEFFDTLKIIGIGAVRKNDTGLFREINSRYSQWISKYLHKSNTAYVTDCQLFWLHGIVQKENVEMYDTWWGVTETVLVSGLVNSPELIIFFNGWCQIFGQAGLNPYSKLGPAMLNNAIANVLATEDIVLIKQVLHKFGQNLCCIVGVHDLQNSFAVLFPLLERGRTIFQGELKYPGDDDGVRRKSLFMLIRQIMMIIEQISRKDIMSTPGDVIVQLYRQWSKYPSLPCNSMRVKKFCQFLMLYWLRTNHRVKEYSSYEEITKPEMISIQEINNLGYLII